MRKLFLIIFILIFSAPASSAAEQNLEVQGLVISPFLIDVVVNPGTTSKQKVTLTNTTDQDLPIDLSINDFVPNESGDGVSFLPADVIGDPKYSLSEWITITKQPNFLIPAKGQTEVEFNITPPVDAEPGTHYGGILFSVRPSLDSEANIVVNQKAGLVILTRLGKADEKGGITRFFEEPSLDSSKIDFFVSFYNQGNVHLRPKGEVYINNVFGEQVATVPINRDANILLPESERLFIQSWDPGWRVGRYTATAVMYFGDPKIEVRTDISFWILPWQRMILTLLILFILTLLAKKGVNKYNQWVVEKNRIK